MADTLSRKYRPATFEDVVNQQHIRLTLEHALERDRIAHAYLFVGPRGVGKTTLARIFARAICCTERKKSPTACGECPSCKAMADGRSLDVIEIDAASQTGVDHVRENIIQSARAVPTLGRYKVYIIDEVHMLSLSAFNALLKILEEPPAHALFILATTDVHRIPETVISRTQRFDFKKIPLTLMIERLNVLAGREKRTLADGVAARIARLSSGSLRDAESMLGQLLTLKEKTITTEMADLILPRSDIQTAIAVCTALLQRQAPEAVRHVHGALERGTDVDIMAHDLVGMMRALMLINIDPALVAALQEEYDEQTIKALTEIVALAPATWYVRATRILLEAERLIRQAEVPELPLEVAIIDIVNPADDETAAPSRLGPSPRPPTTAQEPTPATTPKPEPQRPPAKNKTAKIITMPDVQTAWTAVLNRLTAEAPSVALGAKTGVIVGVDGADITIGIPFVLHRQRLAHPKNHQLLVDLFSTFLDQAVTVSLTSIDATEAPPPKHQDLPTPEIPTQNPPAPAKGGDLWDSVVANFS